MIVSLDISINYIVETACVQTTTILYISLYLRNRS